MRKRGSRASRRRQGVEVERAGSSSSPSFPPFLSSSIPQRKPSRSPKAVDPASGFSILLHFPRKLSPRAARSAALAIAFAAAAACGDRKDDLDAAAPPLELPPAGSREAADAVRDA